MILKKKMLESMTSKIFLKNIAVGNLRNIVVGNE